MIRPHPYLRNLAITVIAIGLVLQFALWRQTAKAQGLITITPISQEITAAPGQSGIAVNLTIANNSPIARTISFNQSNQAAGVTIVFPSSSIFLNPGGSQGISLIVNYASTLATGSTIGSATISASSSDTPSTSATAQLIFKTSGPAPTSTPQPTATVGPSPTPLPACLNGVDTTGAGGDRDSA